MTIPLFRPFMAEEAIAAVTDVLTYKNDGSLYIGQGQKVEELESQLRKVFEIDHDIVTVNAATSAIDLALHMIGIKPGDEVITTPITCTATNSPIVNRGAIPVWADVDKFTGLINPFDVGRKITSKTKAIMAVNWGGVMPDYDVLRSYGLPVIEDAAHGPYNSLRTRGDYVVWSFQAIKHLTTGDGGALLAPNAERARLLRWYGLDRRSKANFRCEQNITEVGYKYHMNDINAVIGLANIRYLRWIVSTHRAHANYYTHRLLRHVGKRLLYVPHVEYNSAYWIYTILVDNVSEFSAFMTARGIDTSPVHARNDKHDGFHFPNGDLPGVDYFNAHQVAIPVGWWLSMTDLINVARAVTDYATS